MSITVKTLIGKPLKDSYGKQIGIIQRAYAVRSKGTNRVHVEATVTDPEIANLLRDTNKISIGG